MPKEPDNFSENKIGVVAQGGKVFIENLVLGSSDKRSTYADVAQESIVDLDILVEKVREKIRPYIKDRCGSMRVLDMTQPIGLDDIYTDVNILEKITGRRRIALAQLMQACSPENFDRFGLGKISEERVLGLDAVAKYSKLVVLGKPGAGKTTFLKHLANQCIAGEFDAQKIPIFITLKEFAEFEGQPNLQEFITCRICEYGFSRAQVSNLLSYGRMFIMLDGLDEVKEVDSSRVIQQVHFFSNQYLKNRFVLTCRIAAKEYTFEKFVEVEVADFDESQIATFVRKWFYHQDPSKGEYFIAKLNKNDPIKELATNPLLLTLLCLVFEDLMDFPLNRSELYKEGLDILLKKWDSKRNIERDKVYKNLSLKRKEDLLSVIASNTFWKGEYFFKQKEVEGYITDYIRNLNTYNPDPEILQLDGEAILKSIEAQHGLLIERARGVYSFSHLTFHEYFTAKKIVEDFDAESINELVIHITEKRWREVFLLTSGMFSNANSIIKAMKLKIDEIYSLEKWFQEALTWLKEQSESHHYKHKKSAIRAFLLHLMCFSNFSFSIDSTLRKSLINAEALNQDISRLFDSASFDRSYNHIASLVNNLDLVLESLVNREKSLKLELSTAIDKDFNFTNIDVKVVQILNPQLQNSLNSLKLKLPNIEHLKEELLLSEIGNKDLKHLYVEYFQEWWKSNGNVWMHELKNLISSHRYITDEWPFLKEQQERQKEILRKYYDANKLLVDCINGDCYIDLSLRIEIEEDLLLPV